MRIWTEDEARSYLPRLRELLAELRPDAALERLEAVQAELDERGVIVRQPTLVDFPAVGDDGEVYFLCWQAGEDELGWWHRPEDGFAGRQPLPRVVPS